MEPETVPPVVAETVPPVVAETVPPVVAETVPPVVAETVPPVEYSGSGVTVEIEPVKSMVTTYMVGCKLPNGYILHLQDGTGATVKLAGNALTPVPVAFMRKWVDENEDHPYLHNGVIYGE